MAMFDLCDVMLKLLLGCISLFTFPLHSSGRMPRNSREVLTKDKHVGSTMNVLDGSS